MSSATPSARVLDLFAVPGPTEPLPGGQGGSVRAGDLVLSPGRDASAADRLCPMLARLALALDTRRERTVRIAMPVPARDGSWVVEGWGASRYEPGTRALVELSATLAVAHLLHAELRSAVPTWEPRRPPRNRWERAERIAFGEAPLPDGLHEGPLGRLLTQLAGERDSTDIGPDQLVHGDLAGNILLDAAGVPVVIDVAGYWRPALWAEATAVLDSVLWWGADPAVLTEWTGGAARQAMLRSALFRLLSDHPADVDAYEGALRPLLTPTPR